MSFFKVMHKLVTENQITGLCIEDKSLQYDEECCIKTTTWGRGQPFKYK
jgi:hypothetical protein